MPKIASAFALSAVALGLTLSLEGCHPAQSADVVATVNGHPIVRSDLDKQYDVQLGESPQQEKPSQEQADSLRLGLLHQLIDEEIVQQRAAKMNLTATPEEVDAKFAEMKAPYPDEQQFNQRLAANHTTVDDIKRNIRRTLTINKLLNKEINSKINVSDADIASFYALHKSDFNNIHPQVSPGTHRGDHVALRGQQPAGEQSHQRHRSEEEGAGAAEPHRFRRRLWSAGDELLRRPGHVHLRR